MKAHIAETHGLWTGLLAGLTLAPRELPSPWIEDVKRIAAEHFGVTPSSLCAPRQDGWSVHRRHVAMYVARKTTGKSSAQIGQRFGGFDQKTVFHACRKIAARLASGSAVVTADVNAILARIETRPHACADHQ